MGFLNLHYLHEFDHRIIKLSLVHSHTGGSDYLAHYAHAPMTQHWEHVGVQCPGKDTSTCRLQGLGIEPSTLRSTTCHKRPKSPTGTNATKMDERSSSVTQISQGEASRQFAASGHALNDALIQFRKIHPFTVVI